VLIKNAEKTINLTEAWNLENGYSLSLKLISSKGDTAMLELRKGEVLLIQNYWVLEESTNTELLWQKTLRWFQGKDRINNIKLSKSRGD